MRYKEYHTILDGTVKKFGILGETHVYNREESLFARMILPQYDLIVIEGAGTKPRDYAANLGDELRPLFLAFVQEHERTHPNAVEIAHESGRKIIGLEAGFPLKIPSLDASFFMNGKEYTLKSYFAAHNNTDNFNCPGRLDEILAPVLWHIFEGPRRDELMAAGAAAYLRFVADKVLLVCGDKHLDGVEALLIDRLQLREVKRHTV